MGQNALVTWPVRISAPELATRDNSYGLLTTSEELDQAPDGAILDASRTRKFGPLGVAILGASALARKELGHRTGFELPSNQEAAKFAKEVQLDRLVRGESTDALGQIAVRQLKAIDPSYTQQVAHILEKGETGLDEDTAYTVQLCLNELMQNVFEWAESRIGCVLITRWFHKTRGVRLAIVDRGVGIPQRLRGVEKLRRLTDAEAVIAAVTEEKLTSRAGGRGGLGLKLIRQTVTERGGRMIVISNTARVLWHGNRVSKFEGPFFPGTAVEVDFQPEKAVDNPHEYVPVF
jgi:two-component sensor histidine kinase